MIPRIRLLLLGAALLAITFGCSKSQTPSSVSGKITYKGTVVPGGIIYFYEIREDGKPGQNYRSLISKDGSYSLAQLPDKEMKVTIDTEGNNPNPEGRGKMDASKYGAGGGMADPKMMMEQMKKNNNVPDVNTDPAVYMKIPANYREFDTTTLKYTLKRGKQEINIDLTD